MVNILLFGGASSERLVSVATAQNLQHYLPDAKLWFWGQSDHVYEVEAQQLKIHQDVFTKEFVPHNAPLAPTMQDALARLPYKDPVFFLALHGTGGEDGTIQSLLEQQKHFFTGSSANASALAFNKVKTKLQVQKHGIQVAPAMELGTLDTASWQRLIQQEINNHKNIVLKPIADGSSSGVHFLNHETDLHAWCKTTSIAKDVPYLLEKQIVGLELTVGVIECSNHETIALPATAVKMATGRFFDYAGKYLGAGSEEITPAPITADLMTQAQQVAFTAHKTIGCYGYSRTDMIWDGKNIIFLEINTLPGLTQMSFIPQQLRAQNISLQHFVNEQLNLGATRYLKNLP